MFFGKTRSRSASGVAVLNSSGACGLSSLNADAFRGFFQRIYQGPFHPIAVAAFQVTYAPGIAAFSIYYFFERLFCIIRCLSHLILWILLLHCQISRFHHRFRFRPQSIQTFFCLIRLYFSNFSYGRCFQLCLMLIFHFSLCHF